MLTNLGQRIRKLRKDKGLTLVEVAEKTGVAQASLSRIETGTMSGTIESHERIAEILGVGLSELYTGVDKRYDEITHQKEQDRKVTHHSKNVHVELLTTGSSKKKITPLLITLEANSKTSSESCERGVEKFIYLLRGKVQIKVAKETFALQASETLYFDASLPHSIHNDGSSSAQLLVTISPSKL